MQRDTSTRIRPLVAFLGTLLLWAAACPLQAEHGRTITIVISSGSQYQAEVADRVVSQLADQHINARIVSHDNPALGEEEDDNALYVAIGNNAVETINAVNNETPVLNLVSSSEDATEHTSRQASLYLNQPACRHFLLIKSMNNGWKNVAILAGVSSVESISELTRCAVRNNLNLNIYPIIDQSDLLRSLEAASQNNDVLLAIPDPVVYNRRTVKNILLTAYRQRTPVIGYSENFVEAGAVAAVYTPATTTADSCVTIVKAFFDNGHAFDRFTYYPASYSVVTNHQVARSLDIELIEEDEISERMQLLENTQ